MNPEELSAIDRLIAAHPRIFRGKAPVVPSDLPDGWYDLVDQLCTDIELEIGEVACEELQVWQIKEKYAGLRFYVEVGGHQDLHVDVVSPEGRTHYVVASKGERGEYMGGIEKQVQALVRAAMVKSESTCQWCGAPGGLWSNGGYLSTLCDTHGAESKGRKQVST